MGPPVNTRSNVINGNSTASLNETATNGVSKKSDIRTKMKDYWQVYSPTLESMMLCHDAPTLSIEEQDELMEYLPKKTYVDKTVLELGSGIGRYTSILSDSGVKELTAIDFMDSYIKENQKINGHKENVRLMCADVTKLNFSPCSFDLVFSNWLLMYLTDVEVTGLFQKCLSWLRPGGYLFFRESCYHQSGNMARKENPTLYRTPLDYVSMVQNANVEGAVFKLVKTKNISTYVRNFGNPNQLCFLIQKRDLTVPRKLSVSTAAPDVLLSEAVYGKTWAIEGGKPISQFLCSRLPDVTGKAVLDANSGSGGLVFTASQLGARKVHGISSHYDYLHLTLENQAKLDKQSYRNVSFENDSLMTYESDYKYDFILYNFAPTVASNFTQTLKSLTTLLNPSGKMIIGFYSSSVRNEYPDLNTVRSVASESGFSDVSITDQTEVMVEALEKTLSSISNAALEGDFPECIRQGFVTELELKLTKLRSKQIAWTLLECSL